MGGDLSPSEKMTADKWWSAVFEETLGEFMPTCELKIGKTCLFPRKLFMIFACFLNV